MTWLFTLPIAAAIFAGCVNLAYVFTDQRRRAKKPLRLISGLTTLYFVVIYGIGFCDPTVYLVRSGILTRLGVTLILMLLASEAIADWRKRG
jgi:cytochrome c biogenesis protein CcdA